MAKAPSSDELRRLIERAGITQVHAAEILHVDASTLRRWLADLRAVPWWACRLLALETDQRWP